MTADKARSTTTSSADPHVWVEGREGTRFCSQCQMLGVDYDECRSDPSVHMCVDPKTGPPTTSQIILDEMGAKFKACLEQGLKT